MQHLVEDRGTLRSERTHSLSSARRDRCGVEQGLGVASTARYQLGGLCRQVETSDLLANVDGETLAEDRAEHRRTDRAPDLPPELDLAGRDAKEVPGQRALDRGQVEREGRPQTGAHDNDVAHDFQA